MAIYHAISVIGDLEINEVVIISDFLCAIKGLKAMPAQNRSFRIKFV